MQLFKYITPILLLKIIVHFYKTRLVLNYKIMYLFITKKKKLKLI